MAAHKATLKTKVASSKKSAGKAGKSKLPATKLRARSLPANPLLRRWTTPFGMPPFETIGPKHFAPAFAAALRAHRDEVKAIANATSKPTFANTIAAFEKSGRLIERVAEVFFNLSGAHTNAALQAIEREVAPKLAAHQAAVMLNAKLFARIDDLYERREKLGLTSEERRVLDLHHLNFVRAGAKLDRKAKAEVAAISERLASLSTAFAQNVLQDEQSWRLVLDGERDLQGLPESLRVAAVQAASDAGLAGKHVITLARSSVEPFLQFSARRDLREEAWRAWVQRGESGGATDNRGVLADIIANRTRLAHLLGYTSYAEYSLADTMAKRPSTVQDLLTQVWTPALKRAGEERAALERIVRTEGQNFDIAPWDWRYYTEKERKARYDLDESQTRPYLVLDNVIAAAFDTATKLFGLKFKERTDLPRYHEDVRVWEVLDRKNEHVALFVGDYFARSSKRSGAWMSAFRSQHRLGGTVTPIITNVMNFAKGEAGSPALLSFDDARTLFHEFGHALHGLLSDVTYPSISGTNVVRDFVELPSQLYEHWLMTPDVLKRFALHHKTGKPMPESLLKRIKAARNFNQGCQTVEYTSSAILDMALHGTGAGDAIDVAGFEKAELERIGMPREIVMRHRLPHFTHISGGYAAGYYSYMWSEVMDADAFAAFEETGDPFDKKTAQRLKRFIYSGGNSRDPLEAYVAFRGRPPEIKGMLKKRGLA